MPEHLHHYSHRDVEHGATRLDWGAELYEAMLLNAGDPVAAFSALHHDENGQVRRPVLRAEQFTFAIGRLREQHPDWASALADFAKPNFPLLLQAQMDVAATQPPKAGGYRR